VKTVFVATDGSGPAREAERVGAELASCLGCLGDAEIVVAHTIPPREGSIVEMPFRGTVPRHLTKVSSEDDEKSAEELVAEAGERVRSAIKDQGVRVRAVVVHNVSPAMGIVEFVESQTDCAYIVIGNRGLGGVRGLLLGSVSDQVLRASACPVVIVKKGEDRPKA
jgi:nucleotide-binding universal stress UspA family protein